MPSVKIRSVTVWWGIILERGEIWLVNFDPSRGGEMGKLRPAIVMSDGEANARLDTCIVIPLSTVIVPDALPYRYTITRREKLRYDSDACINEIRALSKHRLKTLLGRLNAEELTIVSEGICAVTGGAF